jgi:hypothetical protein
VTGGGRWRAHPRPQAKESSCSFDMRDSNFRVLSLPSNGGLSALLLPNRGGQAPLKPEQLPCPQTARRSHRKSYFVQQGQPSRSRLNTPCQPFQNPPVFSCVPTAASVSTRINTRYQADNRCRQRHRVRKAVFTQLVCVCPKAFHNVVRSGQ